MAIHDFFEQVKVNHPEAAEIIDESARRVANAVMDEENCMGLPVNDGLLPVVEFIITCPDDIWLQYNCPVSILGEGCAVEGAEEILGAEPARGAMLLMRYYGGSMIFDELRNNYTLKQNNLIYNL